MSQNTIAIVPLSATDEALLAAMTYEAIYLPEGAVAPPRSIVEEPALRKYYAGFGTRAGDIGVKAVARSSGTALGAAWVRLFTKEAPGYGYVDGETPELSVAINPAYRGQGIGTLLLAQLFAAVAQEYHAITLSVWSDNPAYRLYQRLGFTLVKVEEGNPVVTMVKRVDGQEIG
ncbi:MAG TPA: N-acetyltransferase [Caldilineaceae bacterium]|nr:N-acetyltransferase [Caldilineaceae bacterium]